MFIHLVRAVWRISEFISRHAVTPFAHICVFATLAAKYSNTSAALPNCMWTGPSTLSICGYPIEWGAYRDAFRWLVADTESTILNDVLLGIEPSSMGFHVTEK